MKNTKVLELTTPIMVNGEELKEIPYCFDEMTAMDKLKVQREMVSFGLSPVTAEEFDAGYQLFLFARAAEIASDNKITAADILRMSAKDAQKAGALARDFFFL